MDYHSLSKFNHGAFNIPTGYIEHPSNDELGIESHKSLILVEGRLWDFDSSVTDGVAPQQDKVDKCCCNFVVVDKELQRLPFFSRIEGGKIC